MSEIQEPVTAEVIAEALTAGDNDYDESLGGWLSLTSNGNVVNIKFTPAVETESGSEEDEENVQHFRAVVVEGDVVPLLVDAPEELGLSWPDGGDLLTLTNEGITFYPRGVDEWELDPDEALELAAQLAAMAYARKAATGGVE